MGIETYPLETLNSIGNAAVKTNLPELDPTVPGSFIRAIVDSTSILVFAAQRNIIAAQNDFFPQTASGEFLDFWAGINALTRVPGTVAEGKVSVVGTLLDSIPAGTIFANTNRDNYTSTTAVVVTSHVGSVTLSRVDTIVTAVTPVAHSLVDGLQTTITGASDADYNVTAAVTVLDEFTFTYIIGSGSSSADSGAYSADFANVPVESVAIGTDKNLVPGALLTLQSTVAGFDSGTQAVVNGEGLTAGSDIETDDSLRERVLLANSIDPGVFTTAQIRLDALTIPTATRVFVTNPSINYTTDGTDITNRSVTSITQAAGVATALIADTTNMYNGSTVTISGATAPEYNGDFIISDLVANTSFNYTVDSGAASPAGGTILLSLDKLKNIPQPGIVYVFVLDDANDPPEPSAATITNVKEKIIIKLPANSTKDSVVVVSPFFSSIPITISGLLPNTAGMKSAIENSLNAFFQDSAEFAESIKVNQVIAAIQNTQDLETGQFIEDFSLDTPSADVAINNGSIGILGALTFA